MFCQPLSIDWLFSLADFDGNLVVSNNYNTLLVLVNVNEMYFSFHRTFKLLLTPSFFLPLFQLQ